MDGGDDDGGALRVDAPLQFFRVQDSREVRKPCTGSELAPRTRGGHGREWGGGVPHNVYLLL